MYHNPRFRYNYFNNGDGERERNVKVEHERRIRHQVTLRIELRDTTDPFAISTREFRNLYRISQHLVMELTEILSPHMHEGTRGMYVPLEIKVLCALSFYASGSYQRPCGRIADLSVSQSMMSNCISEVTDALNSPHVLTRFIHFPDTHEEREVIIHRNSRFGLPRVLGFGDGALIKIVPPPLEEDRQAYFCRKGYPALNAHIMCDADLNILHINAQYPGSCTDPFIYRHSGLREVMMQAYRESRCWMLGDSAYPQEPWLHTPLPHAAPGTPEYEYTRLHCQARNCVDRCIGVFKARWRCLLWDRTLHYRPEKAGLIVNACAVLHNFCKENRIPDVPAIFENNGGHDHEDIDFENPRDVRLLGEQERQFLIGYVGNDF